jgi:hypothetical protein
MATKAVPMLCLYRPRKGKERALLALLRAHWPALRGAGLASARRPRLFRARDRSGRAVLVETFEWKDGRAAGRAHATPAVLALWGPMERLAEEMDFLHLTPVPLPRGAARRARASRAWLGRKRALAAG